MNAKVKAFAKRCVDDALDYSYDSLIDIIHLDYTDIEFNKVETYFNLPKLRKIVIDYVDDDLDLVDLTDELAYEVMERTVRARFAKYLKKRKGNLYFSLEDAA